MHTAFRHSLRAIALAAGLAGATQAMADVTFYQQEDFKGRWISTERAITNFERYGVNDRASSVVVRSERWEVCEAANYGGRCVVLRPGSYPSLAAMGLGNSVSSTRIVQRNIRIEDNRYAPLPYVTYNYRPRADERLYEAPVIRSRAVVGPPEQRCWIEREQVAQRQSNGSTVAGAVAGAVIGGVLGHQIGGGSGKDIATVGGAVAGAVVGANVGRRVGEPQTTTRAVQRCNTVPSTAAPEYWDVTYTYRGRTHTMQTTSAPGPTVTVNRAGEPRA